MGWGVIHFKSRKKINTKSSIEKEALGSNECLPYNILVVMFLLEQGYVFQKKSI